MLQVEHLHVNYGAISAIKAISFTVPERSIVTLIGANGAGKTTTLRTISGLVKAESGKIVFKGKDITSTPPHQIVSLGISQSPFQELPEVLGRCPALEMVGFKSCQIMSVPSASLPPRLRWLILTDNQVEAPPMPPLGAVAGFRNSCSRATVCAA